MLHFKPIFRFFTGSLLVLTLFVSGVSCTCFTDCKNPVTCRSLDDFSWRRNSKELYPGFRYAYVELTEPRLLKMHLMRIDLTTPGLKARTTGPDPDFGKPMPDFTKRKKLIQTRRQTTKDFMEEHRAAGENMVFAVNSNYWGPFEPPWTHKYAADLDFAISDGKIITCNPNRPSLFIYTDGRAEMRKSVKDEPADRIVVGVCGFGFIMNDGIPMPPKKDKEPSLAPRTAGGLSQDGRYLYYLVVDGRQPDYSMGMDTPELAVWMKRMGAYTAINFDGGGSSSFVIWDGEKAKMLNHQPRGGVRSVANSVGFCLPPPENQ